MTCASVPKPLLLTIHDVIEGQVAGENAHIMEFVETQDVLVLRRNHKEFAINLWGDDTDNWRGKQVVVYTDPTVQFRGKVVGGLRLRLPQSKPAHTHTPQSLLPPPGSEEEVPW